MGKKLSLEIRLRREKNRVTKYALRDPRTKQELIARKKWDRLNNIIWRRYDNKLHHPSQPNMSRLQR